MNYTINNILSQAWVNDHKTIIFIFVIIFFIIYTYTVHKWIKEFF